MSKGKNLLQKQNSIKICFILPLGPTGHEFWPKYNFVVFAWKLIGRIFRGPRNSW